MFISLYAVCGQVRWVWGGLNLCAKYCVWVRVCLNLSDKLCHCRINRCINIGTYVGTYYVKLIVVEKTLVNYVILCVTQSTGMNLDNILLNLDYIKLHPHTLPIKCFPKHVQQNKCAKFTIQFIDSMESYSQQHMIRKLQSG